MTSRARRLAAAAACTALLGLVVTSCAAGSDDATSVSDAAPVVSSAAGGAPPVSADPVAGSAELAAEAEAPADADQFAAYSVADSSAIRTSAAQTAGATPPKQAPEPDPAAPRSLIKTGNVALRSTDVADTLFEIRKVVQATGGEIAEEATEADDDGDAERSLLTVRVPVDRFQTALERFTGLGRTEDGVDLIDSSSTVSDVSTQLIDTDVRVALQKRSIQRISILLDRARSIRDIVGIERELANREAALGSLQKRQAFLANQTSLSTITLSVERPKEKKAEALKQKKLEPRKETGFVAGLENGWDAFQGATTGLLTGVGALLPFGILAVLVGVPLRVWLRRRQAPATVGTTDTAIA